MSRQLALRQTAGTINSGRAAASKIAFPETRSGAGERDAMQTAAGLESSSEWRDYVASASTHADADRAAAVIAQADELIALAGEDLGYARRKMYTGNVQNWLADAAPHIASARYAAAQHSYHSGLAYAEAALELAATAELAMAQALGAGKLPSYERYSPALAPRWPQVCTATPQLADAVRAISHAYLTIRRRQVLLGAGREVARYLAYAQSAYSGAYAEYRDGYFREAYNAAMLAQRLLRVVDSLVSLSTVGAEIGGKEGSSRAR